MKENLEGILSKYPHNRKEHLIPILQDIQNASGYLPEDVLVEVSNYLKIPVNRIYGVATFYDQFSFKPPKEMPPKPQQKELPSRTFPMGDKIFLLEKVVKNPSGSYNKEETEFLTILKRDKVTKPVIYIGTGSCNIASGADESLTALKEYLGSNEKTVEVIEVGCLGLCSEAPVMDVQLPSKSRISFKQATSEKVKGYFEAVLNNSIDPKTVLGQYRTAKHEAWPDIPYLDQHPWFKNQKRVVLKNAGIFSPYSIIDYIAHGGYKRLYKTFLNYIPENVCEIIEQSELKGRGGGGFLTGKKWKVTLQTASDEKYLICNADESDPGAFLDRAIIEGNPHRLLEGIAIAAYSIGANNAYIFIRSGYPRTLEILEEALRQAKDFGVIGHNIFTSGFNLNIHIRQGAGAFVCGEETAMIKSLEGKRGLPQTKPPYPAETGLFDKPTIVNNVETLVNVPLIIENGPEWYKEIGSETARGTKVFSLKGNVKYAGFIEVPMGTTLSDIIQKVGGGMQSGKKLKAVQVGGPMGVFIPESGLGMEIGFESMRETGTLLGSGGIMVLDDSTCIVERSKHFMEFLQTESCGKCIPCREGTHRMLEILDSICKRPRDETSDEAVERFKGAIQLETLGESIKATSLCGLGQFAPNPVLSSLKWFRREFDEHIFDRRCKAGVCRHLRTFHINVDICNGCNDCQNKCPETAIIGVPKSPHFIVEDKCNGCGICFDVCKINAIYIK